MEDLELEENKANDSVNKANDQKKKRAAAWYMGVANVLVVGENDKGEVKEFANKDIAEEWVLDNLKAGEHAEISVVYKRFQSKEVVKNEIVED